MQSVSCFEYMFPTVHLMVGDRGSRRFVDLTWQLVLESLCVHRGGFGLQQKIGLSPYHGISLCCLCIFLDFLIRVILFYRNVVLPISSIYKI